MDAPPDGSAGAPPADDPDPSRREKPRTAAGGAALPPIAWGRLPRGELVIGDRAEPLDARLFGGDPYRPDTIADGGSGYGLVVRAASVRGLSNRYGGGPREDDMCLRLNAPTRSVIIAVADGVSAASRAGVAAALAVRYAVAAVDRQLVAGGVEALDWREAFREAAWALVEQHRRMSGDSTAVPAEVAATLATTLLVMVVGEPDSGVAQVRAASVGDCAGWILADGDFERFIGDARQPDEVVDPSVSALPQLASDGPVERHASLARGAILVIGSDGFALPLGDGSGDVGREFARELAQPPSIGEFAHLVDFSRATYDDDRTLVAVWHGEEE